MAKPGTNGNGHGNGAGRTAEAMRASQALARELKTTLAAAQLRYSRPTDRGILREGPADAFWSAWLELVSLTEQAGKTAVHRARPMAVPINLLLIRVAERP